MTLPAPILPVWLSVAEEQPKPEIGSKAWCESFEAECAERDARYELMRFLIKFNRLDFEVFYSTSSFYRYGELRPHRVRHLGLMRPVGFPAKYRSFAKIERLENFVATSVWYSNVAGRQWK